MEYPSSPAFVVGSALLLLLLLLLVLVLDRAKEWSSFVLGSSGGGGASEITTNGNGAAGWKLINRNSADINAKAIFIIVDCWSIEGLGFIILVDIIINYEYCSQLVQQQQVRRSRRYGRSTVATKTNSLNLVYHMNE